MYLSTKRPISSTVLEERNRICRELVYLTEMKGASFFIKRINDDPNRLDNLCQQKKEELKDFDERNGISFSYKMGK
jgi:hypothetical protein